MGIHGMERRSFLRGLAITSLGELLPRSESLLFPQTGFAQLTRQELSEILRTLLVTSDPVLHDFATEVYATCILGKIKSPDPPLAHPWIVPGGGYYAQWLWDTMFVVDLLALLPD